LERTKIWPRVQTGPETKIYSAGEAQQQFNRLTDKLRDYQFLNKEYVPETDHNVSGDNASDFCAGGGRFES
jgi:phytoene/squalene synthetase